MHSIVVHVIDAACYNGRPNSVASTDPEILSGAAVFKGTRVPIKSLFDYIEGGHPLSEFFDDFPSVTQQQVEQLFKELQDQALSKAA